MTPSLATPRLCLRGFHAGDFDNLQLLYGDPAVMHYLGDGRPLDLSVTQEKLTAILYRDVHLGIPMWAALRKDDGAFVGRCGFSPWGDAGEIELAYTFVPGAWGQGFATEAAKACLEFLFSAGRWSSVIARTRPANDRSQRVLAKLGFLLECEGEDPGGAALFFRLNQADWHRPPEII